jgi:hypothetical protein
LRQVGENGLRKALDRRKSICRPQTKCLGIVEGDGTEGPLPTPIPAFRRSCRDGQLRVNRVASRPLQARPLKDKDQTF